MSASSTTTKRWRKPLNLDKYNGNTPLETFHAKFRNCSRYNEWDENERAIFLRDSLQGNASQILWETADDASDEQIIKLLRNRFGNIGQMERYRAESQSRRRKRGESVQVVYQDIRRLMALGFPGQSGELYEIIGRDTFLEALADPALRVRVLDQQPRTLDDALSVLSRMEAYSASVADSNDDGFSQNVHVVAAPSGRESDTDRRIRDLEQTVLDQKREIRQLKSTGDQLSDAFVCRDVIPVVNEPPAGLCAADLFLFLFLLVYSSRVLFRHRCWTPYARTCY